MVGRFLRVPVHCYANDWSVWVHLAGEDSANKPLNLIQTNLSDLKLLLHNNAAYPFYFFSHTPPPTVFLQHVEFMLISLLFDLQVSQKHRQCN